MYTPSAFRVEDAAKLTALMQQNSFATVVTHDGQSSLASHLPMLYDPQRGPSGTLISHMARANSQWQHLQRGGEVLVIFQGPHAYISPSLYQVHPAVPTWNYAAVHAYGMPKLITDHSRLVEILDATVRMYEASRPEPWAGDLPEGYRDGMIKALVGFEIQVTRLEGKFKLGQNRSPADMQGVYEALAHSSDSMERALADLMAAEGYGEKSS